MKRKIRVCMMGMGRTGREIAAEIIVAPDMKLVMAVCGGHNLHLGKDIGAIAGGEPAGVSLESCEALEESIIRSKPDVAIDFTTPEAAAANAALFAKHSVGMVIGTTGFSDAQQNRLRKIAEKNKAGIVLAPNITLGVNVLMTLVNLASALLEDYDCDIIETHFKSKKDKPSGTAKKIAEQAGLGASARTKNPQANEIKIHSLRSGGVIGRHSVIMAGENDRLEISHESFSRRAFAAGALKAARFVAGKKGYFEMRDVLDLENLLESCLGSVRLSHAKARA